MITWDEICHLQDGLTWGTEPVILAWLRDNARGRCVELGSFWGMSALATGTGLARNGGSLICIDAWPGAWEGNRPTFIRNINRAPELPIQWLHVDSLEAARLFDDESLDLVFMDSDHTYEHVIKEIRLWLPKVKLGGILCGHDYDETQPGVVKAVDESKLPIEVLKPSLWKHVRPIKSTP